MSHAYPLGETLDDALKPGALAARTRGQAERLVDGLVVEALVTDWLPVSEQELTEMMAAADGEAVAAHGHLQRYEDNHGQPVLAVTWWRILPAKAKVTSLQSAPAPAPAEETDHTDDLYFRSGRTKPGRKPRTDPNQMDLFGKPSDA